MSNIKEQTEMMRKPGQLSVICGGSMIKDFWTEEDIADLGNYDKP